MPNEPLTVDNLKQVLNEILDQKFEEKLHVLKEVIEDVKVINSRIERLESAHADLENYSRRNNIVIYGIPKIEEENPIEVAIKACEVAGVTLDHKEIDAAHRLPQKKKTTDPPFILRLVSRFKKEEIIYKARETKPTAKKLGGSNQTKLFYNDHLTTRNQEIFMRAKSLWDDYVITTRNGVVYGRSKIPGSARFRIDSVEEINQLTEKMNPKEKTPASKNHKRTMEDRSPNYTEPNTTRKKWQSQLDKYRRGN